MAETVEGKEERGTADSDVIVVPKDTRQRCVRRIGNGSACFGYGEEGAVEALHEHDDEPQF